MNDLQLLTIKDVQNITKLGRTKLYELMRDGRAAVHSDWAIGEDSPI